MRTMTVGNKSWKAIMWGDKVWTVLPSNYDEEYNNDEYRLVREPWEGIVINRYNNNPNGMSIDHADFLITYTVYDYKNPKASLNDSCYFRDCQASCLYETFEEAKEVYIEYLKYYINNKQDKIKHLKKKLGE